MGEIPIFTLFFNWIFLLSAWTEYFFQYMPSRAKAIILENFCEIKKNKAW